MKNKDVVLAFLRREVARGSNLYSDGNNLISYNTTIAEWYNDLYIIVNHTKYSISTSTHQNYLRHALIETSTATELCVNGVPMGTHNLKNICNCYKNLYEVLY